MSWKEWLGVGERRWKKAPDEEVQPAKTLWDWLQLLIVPAILIGITFAWSASQTSSNNKREDRRIAADRAAAEEVRQDATLQTYINQMSDLMLHEKLLASGLFKGHSVGAVADSITLAALRRLDGERKGEVVRFLYGGALLHADPSVVVSLDGADLRGVDLKGAYLDFVDLYGADLRGANLSGAVVAESWFGPDLEGVNFRGADLEDTDLSDHNLRGDDFEGAELKGVNFDGANLTRASLTGAHLAGAKNLDLAGFIANLAPEEKRGFLTSQQAFLDSLSREKLAKFGLSPEMLAKFRREARGD